MDPNSGRLYESLEDARADGVEDPVEIRGSRTAALRLSQAVERLHAHEEAEAQAESEPERKKMTSLQREARRKRIKAQRTARKHRRS